MPTVSRSEKREASIQLRKKLRFESQLSKKLRSFFHKQARELVDSYMSAGIFPDASIHRAELERILSKHHADVSEWYGARIMSELRKVIGASKSDGLDTRNAVIAAAIFAMIRESVASDVDYLTNDTNNEISKATSDNETEDALLLFLLSRSSTRADRHATNINQRNVEQTKQVVAENTRAAVVLSGAAVVAIRQKKTWIAIVDKATRPWHVSVNGIKIPIDQAFEVDGELLMFPGDFSLGATAKNLERCRCVIVVSIEILR